MESPWRGCGLRGVGELNAGGSSCEAPAGSWPGPAGLDEGKERGKSTLADRVESESGPGGVLLEKLNNICNVMRCHSRMLSPFGAIRTHHSRNIVTPP